MLVAFLSAVVVYPNFYFGAGRRGLKEQKDYEKFIRLNTVDKVPYFTALASTLGRNAKSLRNIHYVNFAVDNPNAPFDFNRAQVDRNHLLNAASASTILKNTLSAHNHDEQRWVQKEYNTKGKYPLTRQNGPEYILLVEGGVTFELVRAHKLVKAFLDKKYIAKDTNADGKKKHERGAEMNGLPLKQFVVAWHGCYGKYKDPNGVFHNPKYLIGCCLIHLMPKFLQRSEGEIYALQFVRDVTVTANYIAIKHPPGIKNNKSAKTKMKHDTVFIFNNPSETPNTYDVFRELFAWRPNMVREDALFPQPKTRFFDENTERKSGFIEGSRCGIKGLPKALILVLNSFGINFTGTVNDCRYLGIEVMYRAGLSKLQICHRSGQTEGAVAAYLEKLKKWEDLSSTQALITNKMHQIAHAPPPLTAPPPPVFTTLSSVSSAHLPTTLTSSQLVALAPNLNLSAAQWLEQRPLNQPAYPTSAYNGHHAQTCSVSNIRHSPITPPKPPKPSSQMPALQPHFEEIKCDSDDDVVFISMSEVKHKPAQPKHVKNESKYTPKVEDKDAFLSSLTKEQLIGVINILKK